MDSKFNMSGGSFGFFALLLLAALLVLPVVAMDKLRVDPVVAAVYSILINGVTYLVYASEKRKAQQGAWQTPEIVLHLLELMGKPPSRARLHRSPALVTEPEPAVADTKHAALNLAA